MSREGLDRMGWKGRERVETMDRESADVRKGKVLENPKMGNVYDKSNG